MRIKTRVAAPKRGVVGQKNRLRRDRPREITFIPRFIPAFFNSRHAGGRFIPPIRCRRGLIVTARTNHGNSAVSVRQSTRLGSRSGAAAVLKNSFFLNYAPPRRHRTQPPSQAGVGFRSGIGSRRSLLCSMPILPEREFPALLVFWAYCTSKTNYFWEEGSFPNAL